jgi:hypothetical protein
MQETIDLLTAEDGVAFVASWDFGWGSSNPTYPWERDPRSLAEETGGLWANIENTDFDVFLDQVVTNLVPRYLVTYTTTNTRSDGAVREILMEVLDPVEGLNSGDTSYIAPFIQDPTFDVPFAVYGDPGYTTDDPDLALQGFCDTQCTGLLVNGSDDGLTYSPGSPYWNYAGTLLPGTNAINVFSVDRFGNLYGPATATYTYDPNPHLVSVEVDALQHELILYDKIRIEGALDVPEDSQHLLAGRMVRIRYEHPDIGALEQYAVTDGAGGFIDSVRADRLGVWTIRAKFDGDADFQESGWSSPSVLVSVSRDTDIDKNGEVNALDVQLTINSALGQNIAPLVADSNQDGIIDALDIQRVINAALAF